MNTSQPLACARKGLKPFRRASVSNARPASISWVTKALFPTHLFTRFDWHNSMRQVRHVSGIAGVVHFGDKWPTIPDLEITHLQQHFGNSELHVIEPELSPGDEVQIASGAFQGLTAIIQQFMPSQERVKVLLEFVGRQTTVEIDRAVLISEKSPRRKIF
ncbi:MAG: hypothetical protein ABIP71_01410 [Verrucomicrobiota bacterium]